MTRHRLAFALLFAAGPLSAAEIAPAPRPAIDLTGYRTVADAVPADPKTFSLKVGSIAPGHLGAAFTDANGRPVVEDVEVGSPAAAAGLKPGDVVRTLGGKPVASAAALREELRTLPAGERVALTLGRGGNDVPASATLRAASKPMSATVARAVLGVQLATNPKAGGVALEAVTPGGPAERAGLKPGDHIVRVDGTALTGDTGLRDVLGERKPGDAVELLVERGGKRLELKAFLEAEEARRTGRGGGWDDRLPNAWKKPAYRLAVVGIEYPDVTHNDKVTAKDWEQSLFSRRTYTGKGATGQTVYGSMNDYYHELSHGTFQVQGSFVGWVTAKKKRAEYSSGSGTDSREKTALLSEALDAVAAKFGKDAMKEFDGVFFLYAGERVQTSRGSLYWPHRATLTHGGKRWPYFIVQEGGPRMTDISVFCHEFGHMLGLPDLYARPENPGSEGAGVWCAMSNQTGGGRPQHFSAWSKEQLGWVKPVVVDPRVKQKIVLSPVETDPTQVVKVMVRADGSEYFLLENRRKTGWDASLPGEGLLIWRVVNNRPILEESHGVEGPAGPRVYLGAVPYPSPANDSFTPLTTPSSKGQLGGGLPVFVTNVRRLPDGRVAFHLGYEYQ